MTAITLRSNLLIQLSKEAERRQKSVEELVNDWLEDQLWLEWHRKIGEESKRFQEQHPRLLKQYEGQYIAMRDGVVLDHDPDLLALHTRIRTRYGDEPVLMTPVTAEPLQTFKIRSPRRLRA